MDLKQLQYFIAIAEEKQITAAAKKLHIAQPPLSYQLNQLEEELGTRLVKRGARNIELTDAGKLLYTRAEQILDMVLSTKFEIESYGKGINGVLSIGTVSSVGGVILNKYIVNFKNNYPDCKFEIHEGNTFSILEMLEKGIVDIGIIRTPFNSKLLDCKYTQKEPMVVVMTKEYNFGNKSDSIELREMDNKPLIIYRRFESLITEIFATNEVDANIVCKSDDARMALMWASVGLGIAVVPESSIIMINSENLIIKKILHEKLYTQMVAASIKDRYLSPMAEKFLDFFCETSQ